VPSGSGRTTAHSDNARKLLDHTLSRKAQQQVSEIGGGFSARQDAKATDDANAIALAKLMDGVEVFEPDWADIDKNLNSYVDGWKEASGSRPFLDRRSRGLVTPPGFRWDASTCWGWVSGDAAWSCPGGRRDEPEDPK